MNKNKKNLPNPSATKWWAEGWPSPHLIGKIVVVAKILPIESGRWHDGRVVHLVGRVLHIKDERGREGERALTGLRK